MTIFLVALLLALSQGQQHGWDGYILGLLTVSGIALVMFIIIELCVAHPVVPLRLYRNMSFVLASVVVFLYNAGFMGANFLVALMVQSSLISRPGSPGSFSLLGPSLWGLSDSWPVGLSDRLAPHRLVCAGLALFACDMYGFAVLSQTVSMATMTWLVILQRGAFGMIFSASDTAIMRTHTAPDRNVGAGLHNMHRGIAMAFGVALCSVLLEKRFALHQLLYANAHDGFALPVQETFTALQELLLQAGEARYGTPTQALAALASLLTEQARLAAYQDCFLIIGISFLSLSFAWWSRTRMPRPRARRASRETSRYKGQPWWHDEAVQTASRV